MSKLELLQFKIKMFLKDAYIGWLTFKVKRQESRLAVAQILTAELKKREKCYELQRNSH